LATLKRSQKRRYGSISRSGVFFCLLENRACDQSQVSQAANLRDGAPLDILQDVPGVRTSIFALSMSRKSSAFFGFDMRQLFDFE